jgi:hypothetical protein
MASTIIPASFNIRNVSLSVPKAVEIDDKGKKTTVGKKAFVNYNGGKFAMQSAPSMRVPFGVSVFDQSSPPKYSINLSFNGYETNADVKAFYQAIQDLDKFVVDEAVKNSKAWFGKEKSREVLEEFYTPSLKFGKNKDYPPTMKVNLKRRGESFETKFFDSKGKPHREMAIEELLAKGTQVTVLLTLKDVWIAGTGKFNLRWDADQILINKLAESGSEFGFNMSAIGSAAAVEESAPAPAPARGGAGAAAAGAAAAAESNLIDDDEDDFKAAPAAASVLDSVMPSASAAAADEDDDEDHEPVPAPKKPIVKKKVVVGGKK